MQRRYFIGAASAALTTLAACTTAPTRAARPSAGRIDANVYRAERRFVETRFGRIACFERGAGPAALFLHGFPLNGFQWRGAIEQLSAHRRCIAPDFMGLGYSEPAPGQSLAPAEQAAMLIALLDQLGIDAVDVIANDSGGAIAQLLVCAQPKRVRTLLLTNCDSEIDCPPPALEPVLELARAGRFAQEWLAPWRADPVLARSTEGLGGLCYSIPGHPTDEAIEYYLAPLVDTPEGQARVNAYAVALEHNVLAGSASSLARFGGPVRIVWGEADGIFKPEGAAHLDNLFPASRGVHRLATAKLFFPEEHPQVIVEQSLRLWGEA